MIQSFNPRNYVTSYIVLVSSFNSNFFLFHAYSTKEEQSSFFSRRCALLERKYQFDFFVHSNQKFYTLCKVELLVL